MCAAETLYSDVVFSRKRGNAHETASSSAETTYSDVKILTTQQISEVIAGSQPVASHGRSKVKAERAALVALAGILAAVVVALCYVSYDNVQTKTSLQRLREECDAGTSRQSVCLQCDPLWEFHQDNCYLFSITKLSWDHSRSLCQKQGGDLVKIDSREEQIFLEKRLRDAMVLPEDKFWIGLTDKEDEGEWLWVDGSPLNTSLSFWSGIEPDDWRNEDCVRMGEKDGAADLRCWFDRSCEESHKRICEKPASVCS